MQKILMKIGPKGQVVIPRLFRAKFNLLPGTEIFFEERDNFLALEKPETDIEKIAEKIARAGKSVTRYNPHEAYESELEKRTG